MGSGLRVPEKAAPAASSSITKKMKCMVYERERRAAPFATSTGPRVSRPAVGLGRSSAGRGSVTWRRTALARNGRGGGESGKVGCRLSDR